MVKTYAIFIIAFITLGYFCYNLVQTVQTLREENKKLMVALEANVQAAKDKEERNRNELEQLQETIRTLHDINTACNASPVDADVIKWLQQLQRNYSGTISITFTE